MNRVSLNYCRLGSKHFREVEKKRKTEKRDFLCFACAKNGARTEERKDGREEEKRVFRLCSPTPRKRLLRRLGSLYIQKLPLDSRLRYIVVETDRRLIRKFLWHRPSGSQLLQRVLFGGYRFNGSFTVSIGDQ